MVFDCPRRDAEHTSETIGVVEVARRLEGPDDGEGPDHEQVVDGREVN